MQLFATHDVVHILGEVVGEAGQQVLVDVEGGGEGAEAASPGRDTQGQDVAGQGACRVVERKHRIHSANLQPGAYVANTKFLSVFSLEAA